MTTRDEARAFLGKRVVVTFDRPEHGPARVAEGKLLALDEGGEFVIEGDDGFVRYGWPALHIEAAA